MIVEKHSSTREPGRLTAKTWAVRIATATLVLGLSSHQAQAQLRISNDTVKLGVLTDMSSIYTDNSGPGSVAAAQMAVAGAVEEINHQTNRHPDKEPDPGQHRKAEHERDAKDDA